MTTHAKISYLKSAIRILGYLALLLSDMKFAVGLLVISEYIGIIEEIGH